MVFHRSLSDNKSPQVSRTLLNILANLNNPVVWIVSIHPLISNSSSLLSKCANYNWYHHYTHVPQLFLVLWQGLSTCFLFPFLWFSICSLLWWKSPLYSGFSLFFLIPTRPSLQARIGWSICISKSQRTLFISFSRTDSNLSIFHLIVWLNFNFLHNFQWITFLTQSCLVIYSLLLVCYIHLLLLLLVVVVLC